MLKHPDEAMTERGRSRFSLDGLPIEPHVEPSTLFLGTAPPDGSGASVTVVRPRSAEEVERLVAWARTRAVPITVLSSPAGPRRRGAAPADRTLLVDLSRMKRVFHVDPVDAVAIVEPGLGFAELDRALAPSGLRTFKPLLPRAGKSCLASYLEREPFLNVREQWDVLDPLGAGEMVFGTGERFHTGAAATPGDREDHWRSGLRYMTPTGPAVTDFMRVLQGSQGTLGILTWAAIFCDRLPSVETSMFIGSETLEPLLRLCSELDYRRLGHANFISNRQHLAMLGGAAGTTIDPVDLPAWTLFVNIAASSELPQDRHDYELGDVQALAASEGVEIRSDVGGLAAQSIIDLHAALPEGSYKDRNLGAHREVFFLTQLDRAPRFTELASQISGKHDYSFADVGIYIQPRLQGRNCHLEFILPCGPAPSASADRAESFAASFAQACCDLGGFFSRPYGDWTAMAYARNPSLVPFLRQTKSMFDPDGILGPGRLGFDWTQPPEKSFQA